MGSEAKAPYIVGGPCSTEGSSDKHLKLLTVLLLLLTPSPRVACMYWDMSSKDNSIRRCVICVCACVCMCVCACACVCVCVCACVCADVCVPMCMHCVCVCGFVMSS